MKKIIYSMLAVGLVLGLDSCSAKAADADNAVADTVQADTAVAQVVSPEQSANEGVVKVLDNSSKVEPQGRPLVVDFSATWCGPCQRFKPTFHKVAEEYGSRADFATADVDECTDLATKYKIESIPFVLVLNPDGTQASQMGLMTEAEFKTFLDKNLK